MRYECSNAAQNGELAVLQMTGGMLQRWREVFQINLGRFYALATIFSEVKKKSNYTLLITLGVNTKQKVDGS